MATEGAFGLSGLPSYDLPPAPFLVASQGPGPLSTLGPWIAARVADGGREATFTVEADERFARLRRAFGATGSMLECRLTTPMTAAELAHAIVRWAPSQSMAARVQPESAGAVRVTLSLPTD